MFANPPARDEYLRVRYFVTSDGASWMATELVYPAHPEDRVRMLQSFRDSYRDKAIETSLARFHAESLQTMAIAPLQQSSDALAPVARFFARRFGRDHLRPGERIVRVEAWHGSAEGEPRGSSAALRARETVRRERLREYYRGPVKIPVSPTPYQGYLATERETDIQWVLEYIEQD